MLNRRQWGVSCAGLWLGAGAAPLLAQALPARPAPTAPRLVSTRIVIAVDHRLGLANLPLTVADGLNYFREEGVDVEVRDFADAAQALAAVHARAAHVLCGPFAQLLSAPARSQAWQSFVVQARAPQVVLGVSAKSMPAYRGARDLRGKRVGIRANDPTCLQVLQAALRRDGVREDELQVLPQATPLAALQAFRFGQLDAMCHSDPLVTQLELLGELRVVADTRSLGGTTQVFGGPVPVGCLSAPGDFIEQFPRLTQALTDAMVHALKWLQTAGPSDLIKTVPEAHFQDDRALYLAAVERARDAWTADGVMPRNGPETAARAVLALSVPSADLADTWTNDFATKAKARFRA